MKAKMVGNIVCPSCSFVLYNDIKGGYTICLNPECKLYGKKWQLPVIELHEINN